MTTRAGAVTVSNIASNSIISSLDRSNISTTLAAFNINNVTYTERHFFRERNFNARTKMRKDAVVKFAVTKHFVKLWPSELHHLRRGRIKNILNWNRRKFGRRS